MQKKVKLIALAPACILLLAAFGCGGPSVHSEYSAVTMTNGVTYYGKLRGLGSPYPVMERAFTIRLDVDPATHHGTSVMMPRGDDFHAPDIMVINAQQILFVESVVNGSQVWRLITADGTFNH